MPRATDDEIAVLGVSRRAAPDRMHARSSRRAGTQNTSVIDCWMRWGAPPRQLGNGISLAHKIKRAGPWSSHGLSLAGRVGRGIAGCP